MLRFVTVFLALAGFLILSTALVAAQDAPPVPTPAANVVIMSAEGDQTINNGLVVTSLWAAVGSVIAAFLAGGVLATGGALVFVRRLKNDEAFKTAVENLFKSIPIPAQDNVRIIVTTGKELLELADEVTDGKPNSPSAGSPASG